MSYRRRLKDVLKIKYILTLSVSCISESCIEIKINLNFYFQLLCGASKDFMKAFLFVQDWGAKG